MAAVRGDWADDLCDSVDGRCDERTGRSCPSLSPDSARRGAARIARRAVPPPSEYELHAVCVEGGLMVSL
jgi:hypothetical protein